MGEQLGKDLFFNHKTDNFLELGNIQHVVISALQDEETIGHPSVVGTLQLYNKIGANISSDDLSRIQHIRKLIGATLVRCQHIAVTLQSLVGLKL